MAGMQESLCTYMRESGHQKVELSQKCFTNPMMVLSKIEVTSDKDNTNDIFSIVQNSSNCCSERQSLAGFQVKQEGLSYLRLQLKAQDTFISTYIVMTLMSELLEQ